MRELVFLAAMFVASPLAAEIIPAPGPASPRVQSAYFVPGEAIILTALPDTPLTVMLEPGDRILRVTVSDDRSWAVKISSDEDSLTVLPKPTSGTAQLTVETARRTHEFELRTNDEFTAAYLVRLEFAPEPLGDPVQAEPAQQPGERLGTYRLRGERRLQPADIFDDGAKTWISFAPEQALPAIFAIGASGDEEVVNGYMRGDYYVIDRVHAELVFRIDRKKARARRQEGGSNR